MPEERSKRVILFLRKNLSHSSIIRVAVFLVLMGLYLIILSPKLENYFVSEIAAYTREHSKEEVNTLSPIFDIHIYSGDYNLSSTLGGEKGGSRSKFFTIDPRVLAMNKFLSDYHSPMAKYAETFITEADKYGLDWRLVASISGVESAFGNLIPKGSHNGWGWRGRNGNEAGWSMFGSWNDAIIHITERLALGYGTNLTPYDIQSTYCPPCGATGLDLWANGVNRFMNELQYYVDNLENL